MANSEHKRVEVDASTLTYPEWFFLWAANGTKPDANLKDSHEWHKRSLGMSQKDKLVVFREGFEALQARGFIVQDTKPDGSPAFDETKQPPEPIWKCVGRIVSRVQSFSPVKN